MLKRDMTRPKCHDQMESLRGKLGGTRTRNDRSRVVADGIGVATDIIVAARGQHRGQISTLEALPIIPRCYIPQEIRLESC